jgi:hypothetical protein
LSTVEQFVFGLRQDGIRLWLDNGQVRYRAYKGTLTQDKIKEIRLRRAEIVVCEEWPFQAAIAFSGAKSTARKRRNSILSHLIRRRKL